MVHVLVRLFGKALGNTLHWIVAGSQARGFGPVEDGGQPLLHPPRRLGLAEPYWGQNAHDVGSVYSIYLQIADNRDGIVRHCVYPLLGMLGVSPCPLMLPVHSL